MRNFWVIATFGKLAIAAQHAFSVHNDILAFPQYQVIYSDSYISRPNADALLENARSLRSSDDDTYDTRKGHDLQESRTFNDAEDASVANVTYQRMILHGVPHLCAIPSVVQSSTDNTTSTSKEEKEQELVRASDHGWELLKDMQGNCLYYGAGWWMYSFCYNEGIQQFHPLTPGQPGVPLYPPMEDKEQGSYLLGRFDKPEKEGVKQTEEGGSEPGKDVKTTSQLQTRGETNFLVRKLEGGTLCDLTGRRRRIEVQFHCNPTAADHINMIKETASCVYLMVIHTPRLCNDVAFLPPQVDKPNYITCHEVIPTEHVKAWEAMKAEEAAELLHRKGKQIFEDTSRPLVIGGIEVGAKKLVGSTPETTIKASSIILDAQKNNQNGKFVATLAQSNGKQVLVMTEKAMEKAGMKGTKEEIEKWIAEVEDLAGEGMPWKLNVYKTDEGMEFRAVIDKTDANDSKNKDSDAETQNESSPGSGNGHAGSNPPKQDSEEAGSDEEYK